MKMAQRPKRLSKRSSGLFKNVPVKLQKSQSFKADQPTANAEDRKDTVMRELLYSLLPLCTSQCEIHKNFAKLKFHGSQNSYSGWLGPNGFQDFGKYEFSDGESYRGSFSKSLIRNFGRFEYENGDIYEGQFLGGHRHGIGLYKAKDFRYNGNFRRGHFHGEGTLKSHESEQRGNFRNGILMKGEVRKSFGIFSGVFVDCGARMYGSFIFENGDTYKGHWRDGLFFGYGVYNWTKETNYLTLPETKYTGYWMNGEQHGLGMLTNRGISVISLWRQGKKSGAGVVVSANGCCIAGIDLFDNGRYCQGFRIRNCPESKAILRDMIRLLDPTEMYEKSGIFKELVQKLVATCARSPYCPVNPIRIPDYELGSVSPDFCTSERETVYLQQVLSENYNQFKELYRDYLLPGDECMHSLNLNLLYIDVFQHVQDVNIAECMAKSRSMISNLIFSIEDVTERSHISFYDFFLHFLCITKVLMQNDELRSTAEQQKPTYFGTLAMQVLVVLKILKSCRRPKFLVREALLLSRHSVISLIESIESKSVGDKNIRAAYRFLRSTGVIVGKSLNFVKVVEMYYDNVFKDEHLWDADFQMSRLELVEIILYTCQLKLENDQKEGNLSTSVKQNK